MSHRDTVLNSVRAALRVPPVVEADAPYSRALANGVDVVALMVDRLEDYRAIVVEADGEPAPAIAAAMQERGVMSAVIDPRLAPELRPDGLQLVEDHGLSARELDAIPCAITTCAVGVAETGTIMMTHDAGQGRRAISLVPDIHICVLRRDQIVGTVPEAVALLGRPRISTWISGPSATSDIELSRVEGVHGPCTLIVVLA